MSDNIEQQDAQVIEITLPHEFKNQLKHRKIDDMIADLDYAYQDELKKLIKISSKIKEKIEESKTNVKDSYFTSKLAKNNEKVYDMLVQYEQSKQILLAYKAQQEQENSDVDTPPV